MGFVEQLVALLQREHDNTHEHLLSALLALTDDHLPAIRECRRPEFLLRELLENRLEVTAEKEEYQVVDMLFEMYVYIQGFNIRKKQSIVERYLIPSLRKKSSRIVNLWEFESTNFHVKCASAFHVASTTTPALSTFSHSVADKWIRPEAEVVFHLRNVAITSIQ